MRTFKFVLLAICLTLIVGSALAAKDKGKKEKPEIVFLLDDTQLVAEKAVAYGKLIQIEALASLTQSAEYLGKSDFTSIAEAYDKTLEDIAWSHECALQALDLRKDVVAARAEASATSAANAGGEPADLSLQMKAKIEGLNSGAFTLSDSQKEYFLVSLTRLAAAIAKETLLVVNAKTYAENVKSMSALAKAKEAKNLPKAASMVSTLPGNLVTQLATLVTYVTIAKTNGIKIPDDVSKLLP